MQSQEITNATSENVGTKLLFENERVRVWDLALEAGESVEKHFHRHDYLIIVLQGGDLRHVDPEHPENDRAVHFENDQVLFGEGGSGVVHDRLVNVGNQPYRNLVVELKRD